MSEYPAYWHLTKHNMNRRCVSNDYYAGGKGYMLTLKVEEMAQLFGTICLQVPPEAAALPAAAGTPNLAALTPGEAAVQPAAAGTPNLAALTPGGAAALPAAAGTQDLAALAPGGAAAQPAAAAVLPKIGPEMVTVRLSPLGEAVRRAWLTLPERFPNLLILDGADEYVIMPEHFHGILYVSGDMETHLGRILTCFKSRITMAYRQLLIDGRCSPVGQAREWLCQYRSLPPEQQAQMRDWVAKKVADLFTATGGGCDTPPPFKITTSGSHNRVGFLFAEGYTDGVLLDEETLQQKQVYIRHNPYMRWLRNSRHEWLYAQRGGVDTGLYLPALHKYLCAECAPKDATPEILAGIDERLLTKQVQLSSAASGPPVGAASEPGPGFPSGNPDAPVGAASASDPGFPSGNPDSPVGAAAASGPGFSSGNPDSSVGAASASGPGFSSGNPDNPVGAASDYPATEVGAGPQALQETCLCVDCDTYGNRELLDRARYRLLPLVCHRRDVGLYEQQRARCLAEAAQGAVIVSACISPKERALLEEIVAAGYCAIRIEDNGFPEVYHPSEARVQACHAGHYLIVTPWRFQYRRKEDAIRTAFCKAMNCLAQALCRRKDDWWK